MREQEERLARAKNNKENELRERIRERQQKELERQKAALDRRCAQLNKLTAKKEVSSILHFCQQMLIDIDFLYFIPHREQN